jgi:hypothetical protein
MTMYDFMVNAFYMLCGVVCVAASVLIVYVVVATIFKIAQKGGKRNGRN